jgi:putative spermidine/putrescine transport system substrate-binding protein
MCGFGRLNYAQSAPTGCALSGGMAAMLARRAPDAVGRSAVRGNDRSASLPTRIRTAHATVTDLIRDEILSGRIAPGDRLLQNDLAARFSLSTTPVREALRQLVTEGLLDADPHRGTTVHQISRTELEQICRIRLALEPLEIEAAVIHITDAQIERAADIVATIDRSPDPALFPTLNAEFHSVVSEAAQWPRLANILDTLRVLSAMYMAAWLRSEDPGTHIARSNADHLHLVEALRSRDVSAAQRIIRLHIKHTLQAGRLALAREDDGKIEVKRRRARSHERTIRLLGISTTMQPEMLDRFHEDTGIRIEPVVGTLTGNISRMLSEPERYDAVDQNATYLRPMLEAGVLAPIPVDAVPNWRYARPLFTVPDAPGSAHGWPISEVYWPGAPDRFACVPQYFNYEAMGYNRDLIEGRIDSYAAMFDPAHAGKVAIWNDAIWTIGLVAIHLAHSGRMPPPAGGPGNLTRDEVDIAIEFLKRRKRAGQFRAFWSDFSEVTNLLASGEVAVADAWIPAFENAKRMSGADLAYINPKEGNRPWFHGLGLSATSAKLEEVAALANWRLDGWFGGQVAPLGYYSPTTTVEAAMEASAYAVWYGGERRETGSYDERTANVAFWPQWPAEYDYYLSAWSRFVAS